MVTWYIKLLQLRNTSFTYYYYPGLWRPVRYKKGKNRPDRANCCCTSRKGRINRKDEVVLVDMCRLSGCLHDL